MSIYQKILTQYWGYSSFRPLQEEIIQSIAEGNDTLALMPTGGGKSITFQVPALAKEGICIVVTPLIALMKDQVDNLVKRNIKAVAVYSGMRKEEIDITLDNCIYGNIKFLYCSPERLDKEIFKHRVQKMNVNLIAVDESHCISQWGYDFRPSYLKIADLRKLVPNVPVLALTATATHPVIEDIQEKLLFKKPNVISMSFERKNLIYLVREVDDKLKYLLKIITTTKGSGIVYTRTRQKAKDISSFLNKNKISADFYHAGLTDEMRHEKHTHWKSGECRVIIATNAFGMGIDKHDVRFVVHFDLPDSVEAYYQEAGRAGRDEKKAYAVLLFNGNDKLSVQKRIGTNFPDISTIKLIYNALGNYLQIPIGSGKSMVYDFYYQDFAVNYKLNIQIVYSSLKILEREGYVELVDELNSPSKVHFTVQRDDLYKFQVENMTFDTFIKLLLRSYTGLFTDFAGIDEMLLAKRAGTNVDNIYSYLKKLSQLKIITYIPRKNNPVIIFTEVRMDDKNLFISIDNYNRRKYQYEIKVNAMLHYAETVNKCRSQMLLSYFGDKDPYRCGQCDFCQGRNELGLSKYEFDLILEELKKLSDGTFFMEDMIDKISLRFKEGDVIKVFQWLLDKGKIHKNDEGKTEWIKS